MYRTHNCGELSIANKDNIVILSGWVQKIRDKGAIIWVDIRDRYGITQLVIKEESQPALIQKVRTLGREFVIQAKGKVIPRFSVNKLLPTGEIEIELNELNLLNASKTPPFIIEEETDGGEELRMKYRYLDLRRSNIQNNILLRSQLAQEVRNYLNQQDFIEVETPVLIKSTPEGARDFIVPSRMNQGEFYALPQSPQTFKQLLMISGFDKYYQIVKCFRDEDLRADRQPEFTQIDCEMSFVEIEDILNIFEGFVRHLFKVIKQVTFEEIPRITFADAIKYYGTDKPDLRFGMPITDLTSIAQGSGFQVFDNAEVILAINVKGCANYTRKQIDALTDWVKRPQIGAKGLVYIKYQENQSFKSSIDKFFDQSTLKKWAEHIGEVEKGDMLLLLSGEKNSTYKQLGELRLYLGKTLALFDAEEYKPLWVTDFPLLEWDEEAQRYHAMHHPFTSPVADDLPLLEQTPEKARAQAYDMVINGVEIGGGSVRIHDKSLQQKMFKALGFTPEEAQRQFGFLLDAFEYGAPPHGGIAFGFDRMCSLFANKDSIRDFIAFPKNNSGRDVMIDAPSSLDKDSLNELGLKI